MFCLFVTVTLNGKHISLPKYRLPLTVTSAFLVAGTNPTARSLNDIFIMALSPGNVGETELESDFTSQLREAALGTALEIRVGEALGRNAPDALNLLGMAEHFRNEVIFPGLT